MKKIEAMVNMSVKELRQVAKDMEIAGRWDMTKTQLIEAIEKRNAERAAEAAAATADEIMNTYKNAADEQTGETKESDKETKKACAMKIQRAFIEVGEARKQAYRYITITVKNVTEEEAAQYIEKVCNKMTEMDEEFQVKYEACRVPDIDEETKSYTDMIAFEKAPGHIAAQRRYVGKLMTKAMAALKETK